MNLLASQAADYSRRKSDNIDSSWGKQGGDGGATYPIARRVRAHATSAAAMAAGAVSRFHDLRLPTPATAAAAPTTPASSAKMTKNPDAALPMGKKTGEKCAGSWRPGPALADGN